MSQVMFRQRTRGTKPLQNRWAHRLLFLILIGLLAGFSVWSLWLLGRAQHIRGELDLCFGWLDDVHAVRGELERLREAGASAARPEKLEVLQRQAETWLLHTDDPGLGVAFQKLRLTLKQLPGGAVVEGDPSATDDTSDALWQASVAALGAADELEARVRGHVARLHDDLGDHWLSLRYLVFGSLLLAASNLILLLAMQRRRYQLEVAHSQALSSARHDALTGLWNREGILRLLGHELVRASRSRAPLSAILADLDNFKAVNELLGHEQGDYILEQVSKRLVSLVRPYDTMGRVGGDSFLIVLPACDATATERVAERLVEAVNERDVKHAFGRIRVNLNLATRTVVQASETDVDTILRQLQEGIDVSKTSIPRPTELIGLRSGGQRSAN